MLVQSLRLADWLRRGAIPPAPRAPGLWGEIFYHAEKHLQADVRVQEMTGDEILQQVFSGLQDGVVMLDAEDVIGWCNEAASAFLGLRFPEDRGRPLTHLVRMPAFADFLRQQNFDRTLETHLAPGVDRRLQFYLARFSSAQRLLFIRDVTAADNLERVRRDFSANLSHELRIPLTVIIGYLEMLTQEPPPGNPAEILGEMRVQAQRMSSLVTRMMELARLESAPGLAARLPVDTTRLLEQVCKELQPLAADNSIRLEVAGAPALLGEEADLASAFSNLVRNAIRAAAPKKGEICVRAFEQEGKVLVEIQDKGVGMEAHHLPRITERFYRTEGSGSTTGDTGSGLGLAIVKHVLERHEASLLVESSVGKGSLFRCVFPLSRRAG